MKSSVIRIENWWIKYKYCNFCIGNCQKFVENTIFIGQLPTKHMSCYNYIYMCQNCIEKLKYTTIENEIEGYCIGQCEQVVENSTIIGKYEKNNKIFMCKNCIKTLIDIKSDSSYSQNYQDNC